MSRKAKTIVFIIGVVAIITALIYFSLSTILPDFISIVKRSDADELQEYLRSFDGLYSVIILFAMQFFQVVSIVFPGLPIQVSAGVVFGFVRGFIICHIAYTLANIAVFSTDRKIRDAAQDEKEDLPFKKYNVISNSKYPWFMVILACMIPLMPNGIIPYLSARSKISLKEFAVSVFFGSAAPIAMSCLIGHHILEGNFVFTAVLTVTFVAVIAVLYIYSEKIVGLFEKMYSGLKK